MRPVPVLMYHHVNPHRGDMVTVTPGTFEEQMRFLSESRIRTFTIDELLSYMKGDLRPREKAVAVTFDDGWLDNYVYAFPVLRKYRIQATIFIVTDRAEKASEKAGEIPSALPAHRESTALLEQGEEQRVALNWDLIREMAQSGLVRFYSHTKTHRKCDRIPEEEISEELGGSKRVIEEKLGKPCPYLCWPYGKYSALSVDVAKRLGYNALFTTKHGVVTRDTDPLVIQRIVAKDNAAWFKKRIRIYTNDLLSRLYLRFKRG